MSVFAETGSGCNKDLNGAAMVKSVKLLADLLGKKTIAEWAENIEIEKTI